MAKKNIVRLCGIVHRVISEEPMAFVLKTKRHIDKMAYPTIVLAEDANPDIHLKYLVEGAVVLVTGQLRTENQVHSIACPCCGETIENRSLNTYIEAANVCIFKPLGRKDTNIFANNVVLLGTLCRQISFKYSNSASGNVIANAKFQMAVNRRIPNETDYPWVCSFARQAEEDYTRINTGSQVLVDGVLATKEKTKEVECPSCCAVMEIKEVQTEVSAKSVEYLNNCNFETAEGKEEKQASIISDGEV